MTIWIYSELFSGLIKPGLESPFISRITFSPSITSNTSDKYLLLNAIFESWPDELISNMTEFSPNSSVFDENIKEGN